jgi:hypothetical protein
MWATLHAFEHNNLDGMTLIPAQIRADTASIMGAETSIRDHLVEEWRPNTLGYICPSERSLQKGAIWRSR